MLAENFVERGGGRRQAGACQVRQQSYTEFSATDDKGFYLKLVLPFIEAVLTKYISNAVIQ